MGSKFEIHADCAHPMQSLAEDQPASLCFRAGRSGYIVFGTIFGVLLLMSLACAMTDRSWWLAVAMLALLLAGAFAWLRAYRIEFSNDTLSFRNLVHGTRLIPVAEIQRARILIGCYADADRFRPTTRLVLDLQPGQRGPIVINLRVFSRQDIARLLDWLEARGVGVPE